MLTICSCVIELSVVASHLVWRLRTRGIRKDAQEAGQSFDDYREAVLWQSKGFDAEKVVLEILTRLRRASREDHSQC